MSAVLGGLWQIFESLNHEGYSNCFRSSQFGSFFMHRLTDAFSFAAGNAQGRAKDSNVVTFENALSVALSQ
jgi:hypothetical protein